MGTFRECLGKVPSDLYAFLDSSAIVGTSLKQYSTRAHDGIRPWRAVFVSRRSGHSPREDENSSPSLVGWVV